MAQSESEFTLKMEEEIQSLKEQLKQKDHDIQKVAEIGKALLDKNDYMRSHNDDLVKDYSGKVENLQQEIYELQRKLEGKEQSESWYKDEVGHLRNEQQKQIEEVRESLEACNTQAVSKLTRQISQLQYELEKSQNCEFQLQEKILELEDLIQCRNDKSETTCKSFSIDDTSQLQELLDLQNENTSLKSDLICCRTDAQKMRVELEKLGERVKLKDLEVEEIQCQCTSYINSLENARMEIMDLKVQMDALRIEETIHSKKGNSLFSEVEDRRVSAEKKLITLKVQNDALKDKYELERQQHHKLKMQMVVLLQMSRGGVDSEHVTTLESKLSAAREEVRNLTQKLHETEANQKCEGDVLLEFQQKFGDMTNKDYAGYLITLLKSKEEEVLKLTADIKIKSMHLLDERNKTSINERKLYDVGNERDKFHSQNMKLALKVEELLQKYEPEVLKNRKAAKPTKKEKIPLPGESDENTLCLKETTLNKSHSKSVVEGSSQSVLNETNPLAELELNREPICPSVKLTKTCTVKISENVTVFDSEGHAEKTGVSDDVEKKKLQRSKPKGHIQQNIKQVVIPDDAPSINDCKTQ